MNRGGFLYEDSVLTASGNIPWHCLKPKLESCMLLGIDNRFVHINHIKVERATEHTCYLLHVQNKRQLICDMNQKVFTAMKKIDDDGNYDLQSMKMRRLKDLCRGYYVATSAVMYRGGNSEAIYKKNMVWLPITDVIYAGLYKHIVHCQTEGKNQYYVNDILMQGYEFTKKVKNNNLLLKSKIKYKLYE